MWEMGDADSVWGITEGVQESVCATEDRLCVYLPVWVILVVWYACHPLVWSQVCLGLLGKKNAQFRTNVLFLLPTRFDFPSSPPSPPLVFCSGSVWLSWFLSLLPLSAPAPALYFLRPAQWLLRSAVPCCSYQFERMFDTCRIPGTLTGSLYIFTRRDKSLCLS